MLAGPADNRGTGVRWGYLPVLIRSRNRTWIRRRRDSRRTAVDLYDCNSTAAQVFIPQSDGSLYNPQSGKCLDDTGWSITPGTQLEIWDCTGNANQQWSLP